MTDLLQEFIDERSASNPDFKGQVDSALKRRRTARVAHDNYGTPSWCVRRLLESNIQLPQRGRWLEPCAGGGNIIRAVNAMQPGNVWTAYDIRDDDETRTLCDPDCADEAFIGTSFLDAVFTGQYFDVAMTNPPFSLAAEFERACRPIVNHVVMLLRLNFLGSAAKRMDVLTNPTPDVYVLPNRPSFRHEGRTDMTEYAWYHWHDNATGKLTMLALTPAQERRADFIA